MDLRGGRSALPFRRVSPVTPLRRSLPYCTSPPRSNRNPFPATSGGGKERRGEALATGAAGAEVEAELRRLVVDGRESGVSFDDFPYYLSEQMKLALTSAAYSCLSQKELPKHIRVLANVSRTILLCGTSELYLKSLAKALAHQFDACLLPLDVDEFSRRL